MKRYFTLFLFVCTAFLAYGQGPTHRTCGTMEHFQMMSEQYPNLLHDRAVQEQQIQEWIDAHPNYSNDERATYTIPIVFHVVYGNANENISDALVLAQLDQLNADFQAMNSDIGNVPSEFPVGNVDIEFCLAQVDPNGNPTTGITRTQTSVSTFNTNDNVKFSSSGGIDAWNTNVYYNVWICDTGPSLLGYAQFPMTFASQPNTDGLVIGYPYVGSLDTPNPINTAFRYGRTATHEVGHCLNLFHIWGDFGGCNGDDNVADTPNSQSEYYNCPSYPSTSCGSADMTMNFMDYVNDQCMNAFTPGQAQRITAAINTYQYLQNKIASAPTVCGAQPPSASISSSSSSGCAPLAVTFMDDSSNSPTSWSWSFPGGSPASSTAQNPPVVNYANPGTYTVTLTVTNAEGSDTETMQVVVTDCSNISCTLYDNLNNGTITLIENNATGQAAGGYVAGHNGYGDIAKAEYFTNMPADAQLDGVEYDFGYAAGSGTVEFVIWADNNGEPGNELYTETINTSTIISDVNGNTNTTVGFGGLQSIPSSFFAGIKLDYDNGSDVALNTNTDGDSNPTTAWEQWGDNTWYPYNDYTNSNTTWEIDVAHAIYPNICTTSTTPQAPTANFTTSVVNQGCETIQVQYTDNSTNGPTSWSWSFPGGSPSSSTMQNPVVAYTSAGAYNASLTATNAVGSNSTTQNGVVNLPSPITANASATPTTVDVSTGGNVNFQDNTSGATSWSWDFGDGGSSNMQNPSHAYSIQGTYTVTLTVSDGFCTETFTLTITVTDTTSIEDIAGLNSMSIYPNPVSGTFYLELASDEALELQVEIYDAVGRKVMNGGIVNVMGNTIHTLDASKLTTGTYFVRITNGSDTATTKFLKF